MGEEEKEEVGLYVLRLCNCDTHNKTSYGSVKFFYSLVQQEFPNTTFTDPVSYITERDLKFLVAMAMKSKDYETLGHDIAKAAMTLESQGAVEALKNTGCGIADMVRYEGDQKLWGTSLQKQ